MEKYKCRVCFKSFINERALDGHMKSHMLNLEEQEKPSQLSNYVTESDTSSSSSDQEQEFDFAEEEESETESLITRKRSKRTRKLGSFDFDFKKLKGESVTELEQHHSSASDTTTEEDLAFCLIMLSRDKWKKNKKTMIKQDFEEEPSKIRGRFKCETCNKVFKSYQALGGHRASHKKNNKTTKTEEVVIIEEEKKKKIHQCPICFRVFSSGQALGGHKRSHGSNRGGFMSNEEVEVKEKMIDLNLPASNEEDDETSLVFDEW
ncbi:hypothetical protein AALP_AA4G239800 [Arabis alpina]|uniref:C2H2-type domain-containing protein n=1 Tax=Arabis alpina TaxID=50452 RepID=A0A087H5A2_ARAAL|nr:hypothetical protein AALP_AA4G239800 [Arabis alpina]